MEFGLNEILTIIDKVKSTELSLFEYQDPDTKIRIKGTGQIAGAAVPGPGNTGVISGSAGVVSGAARAVSGSAGMVPGNAGMVPGSAGMVSGTAGTAPGNTGAMSGTAETAASTATDSGATPDAGKIISSPMVGTFYTASAEGEEPFVRVGDKVKKGQVIGIVEAMKLMNEIESEYDGIVEEVLAANEQMVEYGQPLIRIREVQGC